MKHESILEAIVREARREDKQPLMSFIREVWHGHDYIPRVWDRWISERNAKMFVVEVEGRPVGMNRIRFLPDGYGWLEGARIHPDFRGKGLATMLGMKAMEEGVRRGIRVFRLTSNSRNWSAHRQVSRMGFYELCRISVYSAEKRARLRSQRGVRHAESGDAEKVARIIHSSRDFRIGGGVYWHQFAAISLTQSVLRGLIADGSVYWTEKAAVISKPGSEGDELWSQVCFVGGEKEDSMKLVSHVLAERRGQKAAWRFGYIPQGSELIALLRKNGFRRSLSLVLFEKKAVNG